MARALHVRLDADSEAALAVLRAEGMNDSQSVAGTLGHLTHAELQAVDEALTLILGLRL